MRGQDSKSCPFSPGSGSCLKPRSRLQGPLPRGSSAAAALWESTAVPAVTHPHFCRVHPVSEVDCCEGGGTSMRVPGPWRLWPQQSAAEEGSGTSALESSRVPFAHSGVHLPRFCGELRSVHPAQRHGRRRGRLGARAGEPGRSPAQVQHQRGGPARPHGLPHR